MAGGVSIIAVLLLVSCECTSRSPHIPEYVDILSVEENCRTLGKSHVLTILIWDWYQCSLNLVTSFYIYNTLEPNNKFPQGQKSSQVYSITGNDFIKSYCSLKLDKSASLFLFFRLHRLLSRRTWTRRSSSLSLAGTKMCSSFHL